MADFAINRRAFIAGSVLVLASPWSGRMLAADDRAEPALRFGLFADLHYADKDPAGTRHYRQTQSKLQEAVEKLNERKPSFVVELGDFIDAAPTVEQEVQWLKTVDALFGQLKCDRHYVFGNHCLAALNKEQFIAETAAVKPYYSFDASGFHFVILDACFRADGTPYAAGNFTWTDTSIHEDELQWLARDLSATSLPTIAFVHQRLDGGAQASYQIKNHVAVRAIMQSSDRMLAVFMGHSHRNFHALENGMHFCVHRAMVEGANPENNGYSMVDIMPNGSMRLHGFRAQNSYEWNRAVVETP